MSDETCPGCGNEYKGRRALIAHLKQTKFEACVEVRKEMGLSSARSKGYRRSSKKPRVDDDEDDETLSESDNVVDNNNIDVTFVTRCEEGELTIISRDKFEAIWNEVLFHREEKRERDAILLKLNDAVIDMKKAVDSMKNILENNLG